MKAHTIRQSFVEFFRGRGHAEVSSSSLVPAGDPTLLFTNAGMVQFKRVFQGLETRDDRRAVTVQKCVRAGGKHNDLEQVGHTARHHTFFEMLGNFSFGDYFKRDAIRYGWEWVTSSDHLGIHPDRILVSVHQSDAEARRLWREVAGIADARIYGLGDKDNFWQMGETGPCGPCSEIYVDLRTDRGIGGSAVRPGETGSPVPRSADPPSLTEFIELSESGQLLEIWNLVFMQFDQGGDGTRTPLPAPSVDTGAGLERIAAVMQGVLSNFDTDLFAPILERAAGVVGRPYDQGPDGAGFRVLADHARAVAFLLADGVYPSHDGRGYVLRRILRRAVRHAFLLGRREPTLVHLAAVVCQTMGDTYPELRSKAEHVVSVTRAEEERFLETIEGGLRRLDELMGGARGTVAGDDAFRLYDTFGFPIDLTQVIAAERGWVVDVAGFEQALERQQERSRKAGRRVGGLPDGGPARLPGSPADGKGAGQGFVRVRPRVRQRFVGYEMTRAETEVIAFRRDPDRLALVLKDNPFYAESGGQVSDTGVVRGAGWELPVLEVRKVDGRQVVVGPWSGPFEPTPVEASVAEDRRRNIERNHSATHLVHAALRAVLGEHVRQAGSVVAPDRLRFDFSHHQPVGATDLQAIEEQVNQGIWANVDVSTDQMPYADAIATGAMALFGEKYGGRVRVVDMSGLSKELCGGTHVRSTGQIGLFHFIGESGVAAGVRRIEAVTGPGAYAAIQEVGQRLNAAADALRTNPAHVAGRIESLLAERKRLEKQLGEMLRSGRTDGAEVASERHTFGDAFVLIGDAPVSDREQIGLLMDTFRQRERCAVQVLFVTGERAGVHVSVTDDLVSRGVKAGDLANQIAKVGGGRGGGRPHFASGGVGDPARLPEMRRKAPEIVAAALQGGS